MSLAKKAAVMLARWEKMPPLTGEAAARELKELLYGGDVCLIDGCRRPHSAKGMCMLHYGRWHRERKKSSGELTSLDV